MRRVALECRGPNGYPSVEAARHAGMQKENSSRSPVECPQLVALAERAWREGAGVGLRGSLLRQLANVAYTGSIPADQCY
jgi:hypothetical protein